MSMSNEENRREMAIDRGEFNPDVRCQRCGDEGLEHFDGGRWEPSFVEYCECSAGERLSRLDVGYDLCEKCGEFKDDHVKECE